MASGAGEGGLRPGGWVELPARLGVDADSNTWLASGEVVVLLHEIPPRIYHTLGHVGACLESLSELARGLDDRSRAVCELALWWHDAIYDARRTDNEERSAGVMRAVLTPLLAEDVIGSAESCILATRHSAPPGTETDAVVVDADLSVLGAGSDVYDAYARGIAEEYAFAGRDAYLKGRAAFLESMLGRERLFHTARGRELWDDRRTVTCGGSLMG